MNLKQNNMKLFKSTLFLVLLIMVLKSLAMSDSSGFTGQNSKPNIIYILADDMGVFDLGCYGQQKIKTPNIDKMAAEGMRFTQHSAGATVCNRRLQRLPRLRSRYLPNPTHRRPISAHARARYAHTSITCMVVWQREGGN